MTIRRTRHPAPPSSGRNRVYRSPNGFTPDMLWGKRRLSRPIPVQTNIPRSNQEVGDLIIGGGDPPSPTGNLTLIRDQSPDRIHFSDVSAGDTIDSTVTLSASIIPQGLDYDGDGNIWVGAAPALRLMILFDPDTGAEIRRFSLPTSPIFVQTIHGVAVHPTTGELWGSDGNLNKLFVFDPVTGALLDDIQVSYDIGEIAWSAAGDLYATILTDIPDPEGYKLSRISPVDGSILEELYFEADGFLFGLAANADGSIYTRRTDSLGTTTVARIWEGAVVDTFPYSGLFWSGLAFRP